MPCFQGFPHPFASKPLWKSESESLLRFRRVLTDFRKNLLEFLIEPSDFSPQNHAFGSAWKAPVMPNRTKSHVWILAVGVQTGRKEKWWKSVHNLCLTGNGGAAFFVSDGSNYENGKIRFPYFAPRFKGNVMKIRESLYWGRFSQCQIRSPDLSNEVRGCGAHL